MNTVNKHLLIVEDDIGLQNQLKWCFDRDLQVTTATQADDAIEKLRRHAPQVITLDLGLPPDPGGVTQGFALLTHILKISPYTKVIIMTGQEDKQHALQALALGAYDYYHKPVDSDTLNFVVNRAFRLWHLENENRQLRQAQSLQINSILTTSPNMQHLCRTLEKVAPTHLSILIQGETGTGKELFAQALHQTSKRHSANFNALNCAAIPENLLESELFGYEKGAFTGAHKQKKGTLELTHKGTLFLDEIGDMPLALQAKLLRFLQERNIERIGGHQLIPIDVRILCATHRDLRLMIQEGSFREDLFYRISEITLQLPPLRERCGDAMLLAHAFLQKFAPELNPKVTGFHPSAIQAIQDHAWPGNIRELMNTIKRAIILAESHLIQCQDLALNSDDATPSSQAFNLKAIREEAERHAIIQGLAACNHNLSQTARLLGITRPTLYNLIEKLQIPNGLNPSGSTGSISS